MSRSRPNPPVRCGINAPGTSFRSHKRIASGRRRTREREALARLREGKPTELPTRYVRDILWFYW